MQVRIVLRSNSTTSPSLIFGAHERLIETERHGAVREQLQFIAIDFDRCSFFGAAWQSDRRF